MIRALAVLYEAFWEFQQDDGPALAGYIAFSSLLGFFPFFILTTNMAAFALGEARSQQAVDALFNYAPPHVAQTLEPVLLDVLAGASSELLTLSVLAAIWFSSNAFEAIRTAFDRAYNVDSPRGWFTGRLVSILCVFLGAVASIILGVLIVFGPVAVQLVEGVMGVTIPFFTEVGRYGIGLTIFVVFVSFLHFALPRHRIPFRKLWVGVIVSTLIWIVAATAFSIYLGYTPTYVSTYGALAGVVITLVFLYITGMAIIYGAEVNAVLARGRMTE